jgi:hypothetical protein
MYGGVCVDFEEGEMKQCFTNTKLVKMFDLLMNLLSKDEKPS